MMGGNRQAQKDNRAHWRLETFLACDVRMGDKSYSGLLHDISLRGALVSSGCPAPNGGAVEISLRIPETGETVQLVGRVVRRATGMTEHGVTFRLGMRFENVSAGSVKLMKFLAAKPSETACINRGSQSRPPEGHSTRQS